MALRQIGRDAVLKAIQEFDRLGRESFLRKYGFNKSTSQHLVYEGRRYDSKAIIGAAHGFADPTRGPLTARMFSGGAGVQQRLVDLGFEVEATPQPRKSTS